MMSESRADEVPETPPTAGQTARTLVDLLWETAAVDSTAVAKLLDSTERTVWKLTPGPEVGAQLRRLAALRVALPDLPRLQRAYPTTPLAALVETAVAKLPGPQELADWYSAIGDTSLTFKRQWEAAGADDPATVRLWKSVGVESPAQLEQLKGLQLSPESAATWQTSGVPLHDLVEWHRAGAGSARRIEEWRAAGVLDVRAYRAWKKAASTPEQVLRWVREADCDASAAKKWIKAGARTPNVVVEWKRGGVTSGEELATWQKAGTETLSEIDAFKAAGFSAATRKPWAGLSLVEIDRLLSIGVGPVSRVLLGVPVSTALPWLESGVPVELVAELATEFPARDPSEIVRGRTAEQLRRWADAGLEDEKALVEPLPRRTRRPSTRGLLRGEKSLLPKDSVLNVLRRPAGETPTVTSLIRSGPKRFLLDQAGERTQLHADSAKTAFLACPQLRTASLHEETRFVRSPTAAAEDRISDDTILDAILLPDMDAVDEEEPWPDDSPPADDDYWDREDSWRGYRRIFLDGLPLMPINSTDGWTTTWLLTHEQLTDSGGLVSSTWDSSEYAGVGNAGTGEDKIFELRPKLFMTVRIEDSQIQESEIHSSNASPIVEALEFIQSDFIAEFQNAYPEISPPDPNAEGPRPDSGFYCELSERDLRWIARRL